MALSLPMASCFQSSVKGSMRSGWAVENEGKSKLREIEIHLSKTCKEVDMAKKGRQDYNCFILYSRGARRM